MPLILLHGGMGAGEMFAHLEPTRRFRIFDLPGHGHSPDPGGPYDLDAFADELAAQIDEPSDVLGYSLGGEVAFRLAVRHPEKVRRLTLVSIAFRRDGYFPDVLAQFDQMGLETADMLRQTPPYARYRDVSPDPDAWDTHVLKTVALLQRDFDWTDDLPKLPEETTLVFADADAIRPEHMVEFFKALGGGREDGGVMGENRPAARLAILPGRTHYDLLHAPELPL